MGTPPFNWTVRKTFSTVNKQERSTESVFLEVDASDGSIRAKPFSLDCRNDSRIIYPNVTWTAPRVEVYSISAKDKDKISSNTIALTVSTCSSLDIKLTKQSGDIFVRKRNIFIAASQAQFSILSV